VKADKINRLVKRSTQTGDDDENDYVLMVFVKISAIT
jgi:hypothetical protein